MCLNFRPTNVLASLTLSSSSITLFLKWRLSYSSHRVAEDIYVISEIGLQIRKLPKVSYITINLFKLAFELIWFLKIILFVA